NFVKNNGDTVERYIKALLQAENYAKTNKQPTFDFLSQISSLNPEEAVKFYSQFQFEVALDQSLIVVMQNEAQFAIANGLTDKTIVPNYLDFIYTDALRKVK